MSDYSKLSQAELLKKLTALESAAAAHGPDPEITAAALRDGEARLRAILATAVEGIITIDDRGIIESFNPAAERMFGYQAAEVVGRNISILMPAPYREAHDRYLENYKRTGQAKIIGIGREVVGQRRDGTVFSMELSVSEVRLAHQRLFTGFVRDITERKRLEQEISQISELEQRRIGQDLHDGICQHLAGIELLSQVLEQQLAKRSMPLAKQAGDISRNVRDVIVQTRSLARGLSPVVVESGGLMSALKELAENTQSLFKVACIFLCPRPVPVSNNTLAVHLYRIAQEAIGNALKHGQATRIQVELEEKAEKIELGVRDNGRGFPSPPATSQGMGLRIMQYRASMISGQLGIQSTAKGVAITCSVPADAAGAIDKPSL